MTKKMFCGRGNRDKRVLAEEMKKFLEKLSTSMIN